MNAKDISHHILREKTESEVKNKDNPCPGCIMPRLMFDGISTELGLNEKLLPAYFKLRKEYFGF